MKTYHFVCLYFIVKLLIYKINFFLFNFKLKILCKNISDGTNFYYFPVCFTPVSLVNNNKNFAQYHSFKQTNTPMTKILFHFISSASSSPHQSTLVKQLEKKSRACNRTTHSHHTKISPILPPASKKSCSPRELAS